MTAKTEIWNGTSWTEIADLATAAGQGNGVGVQATNKAMMAGRTSPGTSTDVEEFSAPLTNKTITSS